MKLCGSAPVREDLPTRQKDADRDEPTGAEPFEQALSEVQPRREPPPREWGAVPQTPAAEPLQPGGTGLGVGQTATELPVPGSSAVAPAPVLPAVVLAKAAPRQVPGIPTPECLAESLPALAPDGATPKAVEASFDLPAPAAESPRAAIRPACTDGEAPRPEPPRDFAMSPAAEAAPVGLSPAGDFPASYSSSPAPSPLHAGLSVSGHVASLHAAAPAPAELPAIQDAAVVRITDLGGVANAARVEVQHPALGAIQIDLKLERGSMDVHAVTTSVGSAAALRASESALRTSVALSGVELRGLRVDVARDEEQAVRDKRKRDKKRPLDTEA